MDWITIERAFIRAAKLTFSKKKLMLATAALLVCGAMVLFCNALKIGAWASISLTLLPFFLSFPILVPLAICLIRLHHHEAKQYPLTWEHLMESSMELIFSASYLALFPLFAYLVIGLLLGLFFLLVGLPVLGKLFGLILSFVPFLLLTLSLVLLVFCLFLLFFLTPIVALQQIPKKQLMLALRGLLIQKPLQCVTLFSIGLIPIFCIGGLLWVAASWSMGAFIHEGPFLYVLEGFFVMIPFALFFSIPLVFFFNFSAESLQIIRSYSGLKQD